MNILTQISRIFVGALFIFSGFIKANDPIGFAYKLEEYFTVFGMEWMKGAALFLSIFICIFEIVIGFMLLIGSKTKFTLWMLMLMIVFFTFLTFYSAYYNKVTDCGCFGDFLKLTPWQSFYKDLILLFFIIILFIGQKFITPILNKTVEKISVAIFAAASATFPLYTVNYLPVFDFRAYKIGTNLVDAMKIPEGGEGKFETKLFYKNLKTNEVKEFTTKDYPWQDTLNWAYEKSETVTLVAPKAAPVHDFALINADGADYTEDIITAPGIKFFLVCAFLDKTNKGIFGQVNDFAQLCKKEGITFIALTSSSESIEGFKKEVNADFDFYVTDGTQLKTMIRSNPGLVMLDGPVVKAMWPYRSFPSFNDVKEKYINK